jgi:hypothetical protein
MRIDAQTALNYIRKHPKLGQTAVVLYGQSIGGAVAIDLAAARNDDIAGLILENTFLSLVRGRARSRARRQAYPLQPKLVPQLMPFLKPFLFVLHQKWDSESLVRAHYRLICFG